jgi:arylsulfatase A-like enzyme
MEVYAGFLEYTDHHVGRLIDGLKKLNILDDMLIYYITGGSREARVVTKLAAQI